MKDASVFLNRYGIWLLIGLFAIIYSAWSVNRQNRFLTDAVDLAIFDQPFWHYSRFEAPLSTIKYNKFPGDHILGDHFHPVLIPLAFLFRIWDDVRILLVAQDILAVVSVYPVYLLAKKRFGLLFALSLSFAYLSFVGFQTAIDYDFHEVTAGVGIISWAVYFLMNRRHKLFFLFMFLGFFLKEDIPLIFAGLGLFSALKLKKYRLGLVTIVLCLIYYYLLTIYVIPYFKHDRFAYEELDPGIGKTTGDLLRKIFTDPFLVMKTFFLPPVKFKTMINLVGSFAFLPFLSPLSLIPIIPNFLSRFLTGLGQRWLIRYQYNIILTPLFSLGVLMGLDNLHRLLERIRRVDLKDKSVKVFSVLLIAIPFVQTYRTNTPLLRILNPLSYVHESRYSLEYQLLDRIPKDPAVSVMAQSTFVPHLSHRDKIFRFEDGAIKRVKPDYVIMSADEGSDPPWGWAEKKQRIENLAKDPDYEILYYDGVRLLMRRKI